MCGLSPNSYIHVSVSNLCIPRIGPHIWLQQNRQTEPNHSQIYECRNWETERYNSVLEITRLHSFISGNHKWEPAIYIGFSRVLHLHFRNLMKKG
jgi:hypothetical protein